MQFIWISFESLDAPNSARNLNFSKGTKFFFPLQFSEVLLLQEKQNKTENLKLMENQNLGTIRKI